jgi:2-oxoglutarate dehydrogenase E1 component
VHPGGAARVRVPQAFKKDVVIDLVCYRRRGHNEGDDPSYTQPLMYDLIEQKRSVRKLYTESLIGRGDITLEEAEQVLRDYQQQLERVFTEVREATGTPSEWTTVPDYPEKSHEDYSTAISRETLKRIADAHVSAPTASRCTRRSSRSSSAARPRSRRARSTGAPARSSPSARC